MKESKVIRPVARVLAAVFLIALVLGNVVSTTSAQGTTDDVKLSGRIGGSLADIRLRFGEPSWTDTGLIGYNSVSLQDVPTILVVYYDGQESVNKISLVYLEKPAQFADSAAIQKVAEQVMPQDVSCSSSTLTTSTFGSEVYGCKSAALASEHPDWSLSDAPGSLSYAVDPTADEYYEIIVQSGTGVSTASTTSAGTSAGSDTATTTDQAANTSDVAPLTADELDYVNTVVKQTNVMSASMQRFSDLMSLPELGSDSWIISVAAELVTWQSVYNEASQMLVPPRFAAVHAKYLEALGYYNQAVDQITYGIDYFDASSLDYAATLINMGNQALSEATNELNALGLT